MSLGVVWQFGALFLFLTMPWVDLQFVIVVISGHTHLLFTFAELIEQTFNRKGLFIIPVFFL